MLRDGLRLLDRGAIWLCSRGRWRPKYESAMSISLFAAATLRSKRRVWRRLDYVKGALMLDADWLAYPAARGLELPAGCRCRANPPGSSHPESPPYCRAPRERPFSARRP